MGAADCQIFTDGPSRPNLHVDLRSMGRVARAFGTQKLHLPGHKFAVANAPSVHVRQIVNENLSYHTEAGLHSMGLLHAETETALAVGLYCL